jgi:thiol-disulfide isomerase/thioredoxin
MKSLVFVCVLLAFVKTNGQSSQTDIRSIDFDGLMTEINQKDDTLLILNFWATWCKPCVAELPVFENVYQKYRNEKIKIILVNLDLNSKVVADVIPFIEKRKLQIPVVHILNTDPNTWINLIDSAWSGAIPATSVYLQGKKIYFKEGSIDEQELENIVVLKNNNIPAHKN